jgi:hypothetical protein
MRWPLVRSVPSSAPLKEANVKSNLIRYFLVLVVAVLSFAALGHAQCVGPAGGDQICNLSVTPGAIMGDESDFATISATIHVPQGVNGGAIYFQWLGISVTRYSCSLGPVYSDNYGLNCITNTPGPADVPVTISINGYNYSTSNLNGTVQAGVLCGPSCFLSAPITVLPVSSTSEPPASDPDRQCESCSASGSASGGSPINFTNGNTWIAQEPGR